MIETFKGEQDRKTYYTVPADVKRQEALRIVARDRKVKADDLDIMTGTIERDAEPDLDRLFIKGDEGTEKVWVIVRK